MDERRFEALDGRGVLSLSGPDAVTFLQGLLSNDVTRVSAERAIYAALLTAQGKFLHDMVIVSLGDRLLLDCEGGRRDDLFRRLRMYRLRSKVEIEDVTERMAVFALTGASTPEALGLLGSAGVARAFGDGVVCVDPRLAALGARAILPRDGAPALLEAAGFAPAGPGAYERLRLGLGVPDGSRDLVVEKATLLESGIEDLNGIDWKKGCYVGQELTARTKYRGLVRKRMFPVAVEGAPPEPGTPVLYDGKDAGTLCSAGDGRAIALLRLEYLDRAEAEGGALTAGAATLRPDRPAWMTLPRKDRGPEGAADAPE